MIDETEYLLRSPANARWLAESLQQARAARASAAGGYEGVATSLDSCILEGVEVVVLQERHPDE